MEVWQLTPHASTPIHQFSFERKKKIMLKAANFNNKIKKNRIQIIKMPTIYTHRCNRKNYRIEYSRVRELSFFFFPRLDTLYYHLSRCPCPSLSLCNFNTINLNANNFSKWNTNFRKDFDTLAYENELVQKRAIYISPHQVYGKNKFLTISLYFNFQSSKAILNLKAAEFNSMQATRSNSRGATVASQVNPSLCTYIFHELLEWQAFNQ